MKKNTLVLRIFVPLLAAIFAFLPAQISLCQAAETTTVLLPVEGNVIKGDTEKKSAVKKSPAPEQEQKDPEPEESPMSTGLIIGIGVGAAALVGVAVAVGGSSGGEPPAPVGPPTADSLVGPWHGEGNQPGSGLTYSGTYHLYQGGSLGYDLNVSDGEHLVGGGSWRINGYRLDVHTDHGSLYSGSFAPGVTNVINMNANTGWNLTLNR